MKELVRSVYLNLTRKCWSIAQSNAPVKHAARIIAKDVWFHVNEKGRLRTVRQQKKYVHAYVKFKSCDDLLELVYTKPWLCEHAQRDNLDHMIQVTYNPFKNGFFYRKDTGEEVLGASVAYFTEDNKVFVHKPKYGERNAYENAKL